MRRTACIRPLAALRITKFEFLHAQTSRTINLFLALNLYSPIRRCKMSPIGATMLTQSVCLCVFVWMRIAAVCFSFFFGVRCHAPCNVFICVWVSFFCCSTLLYLVSDTFRLQFLLVLLECVLALVMNNNDECCFIFALLLHLQISMWKLRVEVYWRGKQWIGATKQSLHSNKFS